MPRSSPRPIPRLTLRGLTLSLLVLTALVLPPAAHAQQGLERLDESVPFPLYRAFPQGMRSLFVPTGQSAELWEDTAEALVAAVGNQEADFDGMSCITPLAGAFVPAWIAALQDHEPFTDYALSVTAFETNLFLKFCTPLVVAPPHLEFDINQNETCDVRMSGQRKAQDTNFIWHVPVPAVSLADKDRDLVGTTEPGRVERVKALIRQTDVLETDWGPLGTPEVWHFNTGVRAWISSVTNPGVPIFDPFRFDQEVDVEPPGGAPSTRRELVFPVGRNTVTWKAGGMVSELDKWFFYIPLGVPGWKDVKLLKYTSEFFTWGLPIVGLVVNTDLVSQTVIDLEQHVDVWDRVPPIITSTPMSFQFEGTIIGGSSIRTEQYRQQLLDALEYSDLCDTKLELVEPTPVLWPVDQATPVVWTVLDPGPNPDSPRADLRNASSITQMVTVVDTIAPTIRPPEGVVLEVPPAETGPVAVPLQPPPIFDFVDAMPDVQNDAPANFEFPLGLTQVTWTVTDQSGNTSQATQRVNIKAQGTNTPPVADAQAGNDSIPVQSFTPIPITLTGSDADSDPLSMRIEDPPDNGFFEAPLLPYFFGDARVEEVEPSQCNRDPDSIFDPTYVTVSDEGLTYIMNAVIDCASFNFPNTGTRITVLDEDNQVVAARDLPKSGDFFSALNVDAERGFIVYTSTFAEYGVMKLDLDTLATIAEYKLPNGQPPKKAAFDFRDGREVLYATLPAGETDPVNLGGYDVFDLSNLPPGQTQYVLDDTHRVGREIIGEDAAPGGIHVLVDMVIDSEGSVYVSTPERRVHKFGRFTVNTNGTLTHGTEIGWMGACLGGLGCDTVNQVSRGYSCSFGTCDAFGAMPTAGPGQFGALGGMALDPNDILYVAGFGQRRVQRFTPEGFFAGVAYSDCPSGDLCFVLGQFGTPNAVGVNSNHLYVLDRDLDVVHIFDTSVVEPISDTEAQVTYVSDSGFLGADSFTFTAGDGFAQSAPATVELDVTRGFHPAIAQPDQLIIAYEDTDNLITLNAIDPDFPLDTYTATVFRAPEHGTLTGTGATRTYRPDPEYSGEDSVVFTVNDGSGESEPEEARILVFPVNDSSEIVDFDAPATAGLGYVYSLNVFYEDPDSDDTHTYDVDWGDSSGASGSPMAAFNEAGAFSVDHIYRDPMLRALEFCLYDQDEELAPQPSNCRSQLVQVERMADLHVEIDDLNTYVPEGGRLAYRFRVSHLRPDITNAQPADRPLLNVDISGSVTDVQILEPLGVSCEEVPGSPIYGFVCNLPDMLGDTIEVDAFIDIAEGPQTIRAVATSRHPDPQGNAVAYLTAEPVEAADAQTAVLGGSAVGGTVDVQIAGRALSVPVSDGTSAEMVAAAVADAINNDSELSNAGVNAQVNGATVEVNEAFESLRFTDGGLDRGVPVPFVRGRLTLDLDSLGLFESALVSGTAFVTRDRNVTLLTGAIGPINDVAVPSGPPEIVATGVIAGEAGGGVIGGTGMFDLPLSGSLELENSGLPPFPELWLGAIGSDVQDSVEITPTLEVSVQGEPWSTASFSIDAWEAGQGVTATYVFEGEDERDLAGVDGTLKLVTPVPLEVLVSGGLDEVIPGAAELSLELVPEPGRELLGVVAILTCAAIRWGRKRSATPRC